MYGVRAVNNGPHWGALIMMGIFLVVFIVAAGAVVWSVVRSNRQPALAGPSPMPPAPPTAPAAPVAPADGQPVTAPVPAAASPTPSWLSILEERYARGEIDDDEFRRRRDVLRGGE